MEQLESQIHQATGSSKAELEAKREEVKAAHARHTEKLKAKMDELQKGWDAKVAAVEDKVRSSTEAARARHEEHAKKLARFVEQQKESYRQLFA